MKKDRVTAKLTEWLKSTELFTSPSKQLPGKWRLFEYYTESDEKLIHKNESQLKEEDLHLSVEFFASGEFSCESNLPLNTFSADDFSAWSIKRNYLKFFSENNSGRNEEFQFALANKSLKLLQKDSSGKIIFFGFFRRMSPAARKIM